MQIILVKYYVKYFLRQLFALFVNFFNDVSVHKAKHTDLKLIIFIMSEGELQNLNKDQKKIEPCGSCFARLGLRGDK